ncbi:mitochondrial ribosomal protein L30 [Haemaphysalis longicornis]
MNVSLFRSAFLWASKVPLAARCVSGSSSSSSHPQQPAAQNGYERTAQQIFAEVRETRRRAAEGDWEVPKLLLVERVVDVYGTPHWERNILQLLRLAQSKEDKKAKIRRPLGSRTIVKNTPFMCKMLWRVKHLVRVSPITFPDGEPTEVTSGTHLSRDGVFRIVPHLRVPEQRLAEPPAHVRRKFAGQEIAKLLHHKWNHGL